MPAHSIHLSAGLKFGDKNKEYSPTALRCVRNS